MTGQRRDAPRFAVNGDVRLAYDDPGPPVGEPLILIMGLGASRFWWPADLIGMLQQGGSTSWSSTCGTPENPPTSRASGSRSLPRDVFGTARRRTAPRTS
jgi:pimeloyl-ACP methyl ester carboxylesterase